MLLSSLTENSARRDGRRRALAAALSLGAHAALGVLILFVPTARTPAPEPPPVVIALVREPFAPPKPAPRPDPAPPAPTWKATAAPHAAHPHAVSQTRASLGRPSPAHTTALAAGDDPPGAGDESGVSDSELAGAAGAGAGGGGGGTCDMAARLGAALGKDRLLRSAVAGYAGRAIRVWNGDWVRGGAEDGKGLAAVREAIMWEVAFSPAACRSQAVRGLVVVTVPGTQGSVRLALGAGQWRWSDLLGAHDR